MAIGLASDTLPGTLDEVKSQVWDLLSHVESNFYRIGILYNHVVDNKLAEKGGFKNASDFFAHEFKEKLAPPTLSRYGSLARAFSEDVCHKYGPSKLAELLTYEKLTHQAPVPGDPGDVPIQVPDQNGATSPKPFSTCTMKELVAAVRFLRAPVAATIPPADADLVNKLHDELDNAFGGPGHVLVRARLHRQQTLVTFENVPLDQLEKLGAVILDQSGQGAGETIPAAMKRTA